MKQIKTLYQDYRECILDIDIFGRIVSTPQQSLEELTEALFEEFKLRTPMPTLESKRYELSRPVSDAYGIDYEGEVELQDGESLVDLQNGQSSMPELNFEDLSSLIPQDVQECFRYEDEVTADYRKSIVEKYDLETGEEFKPGVRQTENIVGSVEEDTSTYLSDEQIENLGQAPQEEELAESSEEVSEVEGNVWGSSESDEDSDVPEVDEDFVAYAVEEQDDSDGDYVDVSEEAEEEDFDEESDDGGYVDVYSDSEEESDGYVDTGQDEDEESESEDDGDVYFGDVDEESEESDDDGVYFGDEGQESEESQEPDDAGVYFGDEESEAESEEASEDSSEDSGDDIYFGDEESEEASEDSEDDIYFGDVEEEQEETDGFEESSEDLEDDIYFGDVEDEQEDSKESTEDIDDSGVGYDIDFGEDVEPEFEPEPVVQKPVSKPKPMYSEPVRVSTQTPIVPQQQQVPDRSSEPTDIRAFLRKHPRCEYKFALNYFTKKQIDDAIRIGKIIKKGNILKI